MTSTRPYLLRAFYDWIVDNQCTPYILVNAEMPGVEVPVEYIKDGQIVLNIALSAVQGLQLGQEAVNFQARFSGKVRNIYIPLTAMVAIYAKENGKGMVFSAEEPGNPPPLETIQGESGGGRRGSSGRSHLTLVK